MLSAIWKPASDTPFDLLAGLPSSFACSSVFPPGLIKAGNKSVALDGCRLKQGQQLFESLSLLYLINEGRSVHYRDISRYIS